MMVPRLCLETICMSAWNAYSSILAIKYIYGPVWNALFESFKFKGVAWPKNWHVYLKICIFGAENIGISCNPSNGRTYSWRAAYVVSAHEVW